MPLHPDLAALLPSAVINHPSYVMYELTPEDIVSLCLAVARAERERCAVAVQTGCSCDYWSERAIRTLPDPPWGDTDVAAS